MCLYTTSPPPKFGHGGIENTASRGADENGEDTCSQVARMPAVRSRAVGRSRVGRLQAIDESPEIRGHRVCPPWSQWQAPADTFPVQEAQTALEE